MSTDPVIQREADAAAKGRTQINSLQGFDQVIAISEDALNAVLQQRYQTTLSQEKDARLRQFVHALPGVGTITAELSAPRIKLVTSHSQAVLFHLVFSSGVFDYFLGYGPSAQHKQQKIDGWSICFETSFSLAKLAHVPANIRKTIDPTVIKSGTCSVSQLLLTFSASATANIDWDNSICPGMENNPDLKFASMNIFKFYMDTYMKFMKTGPYSVLGYAIKVEENITDPELKAPAPSFQATSLYCQTQAYKACLPEFNGNPIQSSLDQFLFLGMTEGRQFPAIPYDATAAVNWCYSGLPASLCISKRILWDEFFAERLKVLNECAVTLANDLLAWISTGKRSQANNNGWKLDDKPKPTNFAFTVGDESLTFVFNGKAHEGRHVEGWTKDIEGTVTTSVKWTPDSEKAVIALSITVKQREWVQGFGGGSFFSLDTIETITGTVGWSVTLSLATSNQDAGLTVLITEDPVTLAAKYDTGDSFNWAGTRERNQAEAESAMRSHLDLRQIINEFERSLSGSSRFIDFVYRNPTFNKAGDLLVELQHARKWIVIDNDFHLQILAAGKPFDRQFLKIATSGEDAAVILIGSQADATLFTLSNGNLCELIAEGKAGRIATVPANGPKGHLVFASESAARAREDQKMEFSTTGSGFAYSHDSAEWFNNMTVGDGGEVGFSFRAMESTYALLALY